MLAVLWAPATIAAALLQAFRTADQRALVGRIGNHGANLARYAWGAPFALMAAGAVFAISGVPDFNADFFVFCLAGGVTQIVATGLLLHSQHIGSYAVGTTFSKTEAIQAAVFSALVLSEALSGVGWLAVALSTLGVLILNAARAWSGAGLPWWRDPAALAGLGSGAFFALCGVAIRTASLSLEDVGPIEAALTTLAVTTSLQTLIMLVSLTLAGKSGLGDLRSELRLSLRVGVMSVLGSALWFLAMTLQHVAYVRALGQIELIFMVLLARFRFAEKLGVAEIAGVGLVGAGVIVLLLHG
ncbi:DMT family transporter [Microvirga makkahensis]|uniref:EamA family transporter n=1 Tax=Microvirga makkahensis TaxID=1128670 RepID=A0A7X3MWT4_9HYPH|nr:DMT family transporter [Microvirga makkahensis]MXQ14460.1 EamA family transporter [Microvirga makkahensis]